MDEVKDIGNRVSQTGVGPYEEDDEIEIKGYYQWVPFMLFLQGCMFYVPHLIFKVCEAGKIKVSLVIIPFREPTITWLSYNSSAYSHGTSPIHHGFRWKKQQTRRSGHLSRWNPSYTSCLVLQNSLRTVLVLGECHWEHVPHRLLPRMGVLHVWCSSFELPRGNGMHKFDSFFCQVGSRSLNIEHVDLES